MPIHLRPYQQEAIERVGAEFIGGKRRLLVVLPTGAGKTIVFGALSHGMGVRTLVLAHREELLEQAAEKIHLVWPEADIGVVQGKRDGSGARDVVIASVATLVQERRRERLGRFGLVVADEAHHATSATWRNVLHHVGVFDPGGPVCVGVTATPSRADRSGLNAVFEKIAFERSIPWMMLRGYLAHARAIAVKTGVNLDHVRIGEDGDFDSGQLGSVLNTANRNHLIARTFHDRARDRKAIVFVATVKHAMDLADAFRTAGFRAAAVSGAMPATERRQVIADFRAGRLQVVANAAILTEGFDDPAVSAIGMARPTRSTSLYLQMLGRGLRPHPRKRDCLLVDFADNTSRHKIADLPTLFGKPAEVAMAMDGKAPLPPTLVDAIVASGDTETLGLPVGTDLRVHDLGSLIDSSAFLWRSRGDDLLLTVGDHKHIALRPAEPGSELYNVALIQDAHWYPLADRPLDIGFAQGVAEDWVREHPEARWARKDAGWRRMPVTVKQRQLLEGLGVTVPATRGEASDLISSLPRRSDREPSPVPSR